jgi:hypothetical protein
MIPTPEELLISPINLYLHSEGDHPIIRDLISDKYYCGAREYFRNCYPGKSDCYSCKMCEFKISKECLQV